MEPEDGDASERRIKYTPGQQGLNIPAGWRPTVSKPIPVVRCVHVRPDNHATKPGERCNKWSLRGSNRCYFHSGRGNLKNVEEYRQSIIESARLQLTEAVPDAMSWLLDLGANSNADNVRLKAATEVLDRAGIRGGVEISADVQVSAAESPATALAQRLDKLKQAAEEVARREAEAAASAAAAAAPPGTPALTAAIDLDPEDPDIIDGEVIDG